MKLYAISDLHLICTPNRTALKKIGHYPHDWLILAGDTGETEAHLEFALSILTQRFAHVLWVPGNHDLWTLPSEEASALRGQYKYQKLVSICRRFGVSTPEDPYPVWPDDNTYVLAPIFTLYDYSFRPQHISLDEALEWAEVAGIVCTDEFLLHPDPFTSRIAWCHYQCHRIEMRLKAIPTNSKIILINHFPLHQALLKPLSIPRFSLWCGTTRTERWLQDFAIAVVVYGHLHIPRTSYLQATRFEEVSLGYPRNWDQTRPIDSYLRQILPPPTLS